MDEDYLTGVDCVDRNKLWKIMKEMGMPDQYSYSFLLFVNSYSRGIGIKNNNLREKHKHPLGVESQKH